MRGILCGLLLVSGYASAAETKAVVAKTPAAASSEVLFDEENEDKAIAELTAATATTSTEPAEELIADEMHVANGAQEAIAKEKGVRENAREDEIPVLAKSEVKAAKSSDPATRLVVSLGVIMAVIGGLYLFARFWAKRKTGLRAHHQIKVLTQYALGPKKSLAIIRVAGESILIGVSDQNISMIKSLTLLDEELPNDVPAEFNSELDRVEAKQDEDFTFGSVRDVVSTRLRGMRNI